MSDSRFCKREFASTHHLKRQKIFMKKVPEVATASKILPSPSLAITTSGKKLALAASSSSTIARSSSTTALTSSLFSPSSDQHDNQEDYHLVKMSSLQRAVGIFSWCGSPLTVTEDRQCRRGLMSRVAICCMLYGKQSFLTDPYRAEDQTVNTKSILAMRIGKGRASLDTFTAMIGMLPRVQAFLLFSQ